MKKAYVVGTNVSKSLSPTIFNYWFKKYNIKAEYNYKEIKEKNFDKDIKNLLKESDLCGFNITIPFKEKIIKHLDVIDKHAQLIGAVNCVSKEKEKLKGMNTDWIGFQESIKWQEKNGGPKVKRKENALVVGYGGAAKAIVYFLLKTGFKKIRVFNRDFSKIQNLTKAMPHKLEELKNYFQEGDLIINTIPVNYNKNTKLNTLKTKTAHGVDVCYNKNTFFLKRINYKKRLYGHHMLIHQAVPCFHKWFGIKPEVDTELVTHLEKKLSEKQ